jgi:hypothetical protein
MRIGKSDCMYGTAVSVARVTESRGSQAVCLERERRRKRSEYGPSPGLLQYQRFSKPRDRYIRVCPFSEATGSCCSRKDSSPTADGCVAGTNGRAGSGKTRAGGMGIGVLFQGWLCRATTPPICPVRIGCRCLGQLGRVMAKKEEGCCVSGREPDRQTERRRSPNEAFMHGREYPAVHPPPWLLQARTAGGSGCGSNAGMMSMSVPSHGQM